jgi:hypothetical protein
MKSLSQAFGFLVLLSLLSCTAPVQMEIDAHLKAHSTKFDVENVKKNGEQKISFGHFSAYNKEFGTFWMETAGIADYFNPESLVTFAAENNDNYVYDIVISKIDAQADIIKYGSHFDLPMQNNDAFETSLAGYLYATHDEYAMVYIKHSPISYEGYLTNGFDLYEILPVVSKPGENEKSKAELLGYQFKLNNEYVGSLQIAGNQNFRMTNEYCDATEMILGAIASIILKFENL